VVDFHELKFRRLNEKVALASWNIGSYIMVCLETEKASGKMSDDVTDPILVSWRGPSRKHPQIFRPSLAHCGQYVR